MVGLTLGITQKRSVGFLRVSPILVEYSVIFLTGDRHTIADMERRAFAERSEPSSRTLLTGEQPDPWDLLQPQDRMSRHRGAKPPRRYGLSEAISLLSPE